LREGGQKRTEKEKKEKIWPGQTRDEKKGSELKTERQKKEALKIIGKLDTKISRSGPLGQARQTRTRHVEL
jgi:hypothetical protein